MTNKLIRHYGRGHLHFITFTCYRRRPLLRSVRARNVFVKLLGEVRDRYGFSLVGYVVIPEHIHLLPSEPVKGTPSIVVQVLKQRVSRPLRRPFSIWEAEGRFASQKLHKINGLSPRDQKSHDQACMPANGH